jgi:integrase
MENSTTTGAALPAKTQRERRTSGGRSSPLGAVHCTDMTRSAKNSRQPRLPKMGRHSSGQARVTLNGKVHYLGAFGSPEAHQRYAELIQHWLDGGRRPLHTALHPAQVTLTVRDVFAHYRTWIVTTGRYTKNGAPTPQRGLIERSLTGFEEFAGNLRLAQLTEAVIVQWRDRIELNRKLTRGGVNRKVQMLLGALRWAKTRGLLPKTVWADCRDVEPLKKGECGNRRERLRSRRAVTLDEVEKVANACSCRHVAAMLRVQALIGCRPGEIAAMRWEDIDKTPVVVDGVTLWTYRVAEAASKTAHHGRSIRYAIPPRAQAILAEFQGFPTMLVFSPAQSMAERGRSRKTAPAFGPKWTARAYRNAVIRACAAAGVAYLTPHEIRHGAITRAAEQHGVLAAQRLANHSSAATTARYLHTTDDDVYRVAARIG